MIKDKLSIVYVNKILGKTYSHTMVQVICMNYYYWELICAYYNFKSLFLLQDITIALLRLNSIMKYYN